MNRSLRVALITGASRGIGEATAREFAKRGYALVLAARSSDPLVSLAGELARAGVPALPVPTDMRNHADLRRLVKLAIAQFGHIDALIHNAGVGGDGPLARMHEGAAANILATNLLAPIELTRLLLPSMLERKQGAIVLIASVLGHIGMPGSAAYSASKFGLRGFADALRRELVGRGVSVTLVSPGFIKTAMTTGNPFPMPGPTVVARAIAGAIERPRREIIVPGYYRPLIWAAQTLPGLADTVLKLRLRNK